MICIIALVVFGILGIFSAYYRALAKEAFGCVFNKIRLKPCDSNLDERLKGTISGKMMNLHPAAARFTFRHFELLSWIFLILTVLSIGYIIYGGYNYYVYGNCNGPGSSAFCIISEVSNQLSDGTTINTTQEKCYTSIYDYNVSFEGDSAGGDNGI